jgi:hypothetical protein
MSKAFESLEARGIATITGKKAVIGMGATNNCITVEIITNETNDNIKVTQGVSSDPQCTNLQTLIDPRLYSILIRGTSVAY